MTAVTDLLAKWDAAIPWNCHDWTIPGWSLAECREKLRAAIVADAAVASNGAMKDNAPAFIAGAIVRYSDGETALMRIDEWSANGRAYGRQCMGGTVGCWPQDMHRASVRDFATWKKYNP